LAPGSGPRHLAFDPSGGTVYVINEMASSVAVFARDASTGALVPGAVVSTLPDGFDGRNSCAEIAVHPAGKFVYGSNRGHDSIAVFRVAEGGRALLPVEHESEGIDTPRSFAIDPSGRWCLVANQGGDDIAVFRIDQATGALDPTGNRISVGRPVCLRFYRPRRG
jgi:6-phosphogluconolactonase